MKPKLLKISGLNSFKEEQSIDFSELTSRGLFGIFGPTGSGKSTILDAITIALYGEISRGTKEFINTDVGKLYVFFEFEAGSGKDRKVYRVERSIKKKKDGGISTDFVKFYSLGNEGEEGIIDKVTDVKNEVTRIIGLNSNDFTRSVVLPQGRFNEFLKLTGAERRDMLERVLNLRKYGTELSKKIVSARKEKQEELNGLSGELNRYEGVTEEVLKENKENLDKVIEEESLLKSQINNLDKKYEKYKRIWELQKESKEFEEEKKKLDAKAVEMKNKEEKLEKGKKALQVIPYIDKLEKTNKDKSVTQENFKMLSKKIKVLLVKLNETKEKYQIAYERKNNELSGLIEKETNIKGSIELDSEIDKLKSDIKENEDKIEVYGKELTLLENKISEMNKEKEHLTKAIEEKETLIETLKISHEYREKLNEAWELEKKSGDLRRQHKEIKESIELDKSEINNTNEELVKIKGRIEKGNKVIKEVEDKLNNLNENQPKDQNYIIEKQSNVETLKVRLNEVIQLEKEIKNISEKKEKALKEKDEFKDKLKDSQKVLERKKEEEENLSKEIKDMKKRNQASILSVQLEEGSPCPVCGSKEHPHRAEGIDNNEIENKEELKEKLEKEIKKLEIEVSKLEVNIDSKEKEIKENEEKLSDLIERLKGQKSKDIKIKIDEEITKVEKLKKDLISWNDNVEDCKKKLDEYREALNKLKNSKSIFEERMSNYENRLKESGDKEEKVSKEISELDHKSKTLKEQLEIKSVENKLKEVKENDKKLDYNEKQLKLNRDKIVKLDKEKEEANSKLSIINQEISKCEEINKEKTKSVKAYTEKIKNICGDKNPNEYLQEIRALLEDINKTEERLRKEKEVEEKELNLFNEEKIRLENTMNSLENSIVSLNKELQTSLENNGFVDAEELMKYQIEKHEINSLENIINKYKDRIKANKNNISRLEKALNGESIEENEWEKIKCDRTYKKEHYNVVSQKIGQLKEKVVTIEKDLESVKILNKKIKKLEHTVGMLNEMSNLVRGNKFVEYVAINHLKYIAREASKRLMEITNNRYSLELDSTGNFVICDNYNGGVRRDCNTLSGGETFMTSLSLALALSTQIQLKGSTSLEFFFLDEGFGTLDTNLLEVVMTSLEKLHREDLCVGIITHVEELKNRVPVKLEVLPAEAGISGTKVEIKYS